jgi:hypothetical protein
LFLLSFTLKKKKRSAEIVIDANKKVVEVNAEEIKYILLFHHHNVEQNHDR